MGIAATNPFTYGPIALDDAFTDRKDELAELTTDALNGQDVVLFAPRRYGKTSLVYRVEQRLVKKRALVAALNLWVTPTKEKLAARLAREIADVAGVAGKSKEIARIFSGLRVKPTITLDADDGALGFSFSVGHSSEDIDDTLERLFTMLGEIAASRKRRVVLIIDEFQEIAEIDKNLTKLMRTVFPAQPDVSHVYLGSKRHLMEAIFNDENEPFWRSAKRVELGPIQPEEVGPFLYAGVRDHDRRIDDDVVGRILPTPGRHPYAPQELCYFVWAETPARR